MTGGWKEPCMERGARVRDFVGEGSDDRNFGQGECRAGQIYGGTEGDLPTL